MKNLKLLTALFVFILLAACSEDKLPTEPNLTETDKLNSRSAELYRGGVDVVEAAGIIKAEFSFEDNVLLKSLYGAGYSAGDITRAIHIAYGYNSRLAEQPLIEILANKTISDVAELILAEYKSELKLKLTDLKYFIRNVDTTERRVIILKELFEKSPVEILGLLKNPGEDLTEIIRQIAINFSLTEEEINEIMINAELTAAEIAGVLKLVYNHNVSEVMNFLIENGFPVNEILSALKELYGLTIMQVSDLLEELDYTASRIAEELIRLNFTFEEVAALLKDHFNFTAEQTILLLKAFNASAEKAADVLKNIYNTTVPELVVILYNASYNLDEILRVLRDHLRIGFQEIYDLMIYLGFDECDILQFFNLPC